MKTNKKRRYISPRLTGASATLLDLLCASILTNVRVKPLENINKKDGTVDEEPMYFEF